MSERLKPQTKSRKRVKYSKAPEYVVVDDSIYLNRTAVDSQATRPRRK